MTTLDLTKGITETPQYKAWRFPGGEIHFKVKILDLLQEPIKIVTRLNSSDDILLLAIVVDTFKKDGCPWIQVSIPYFPYAQADRNFGEGECFSLKTIVRILNELPVDKYTLFDPHSDVAPALLKNVEVKDNVRFISFVLTAQLRGNMVGASKDIVLLSPDAGAYKKIYKLAEKLSFKGEILCCQKNRDLKTGEVTVEVPTLPAKDILIIDDICVGGKTFIEIAKKIKVPTGCQVYLAVSHGIFSNGFQELGEYFSRIFTTNSRADKYGSETPDNLLIYKIF